MKYGLTLDTQTTVPPISPFYISFLAAAKEHMIVCHSKDCTPICSLF